MTAPDPGSAEGSTGSSVDPLGRRPPGYAVGARIAAWLCVVGAISYTLLVNLGQLTPGVEEFRQLAIGTLILGMFANVVAYRSWVARPKPGDPPAPWQTERLAHGLISLFAVLLVIAMTESPPAQ
jgi:hypothetical protein